jgi:hypothetical protein
MMLVRKHKHIQDAEDRERMIKQELWDVMDDYKVVMQNRPPNLVFKDNRSVLDRTWKRTCI